MSKILILLLTLGALLVALLQIRRWADARAAGQAAERLLRTPSVLPERFDPALVVDLPEPARRYFLYTIRPGTRLRTTARITMGGTLGLGTPEEPGYRSMSADQVLAPPHGFVWRVRAGSGVLRMSGSDGLEGDHSWVRFWLLGLAPVVRSGGTPDHWRSAFGRVVSEGAFWVPASLLPQNGVAWREIDAETAEATVTHRGVTQTVTIRVAEDGRPLWVSIPRWTDANPEGVYRIQPFGGFLDGFRDFDGYRLPTRVEGGNHFGTDAFFPFYRAEVESLAFPDPSAPEP